MQNFVIVHYKWVKPMGTPQKNVPLTLPENELFIQNACWSGLCGSRTLKLLILQEKKLLHNCRRFSLVSFITNYFYRKMSRNGVILNLSAFLPKWRCKRKTYEVAKRKFEKSTSKSIKSPIFETPGKRSR